MLKAIETQTTLLSAHNNKLLKMESIQSPKKARAPPRSRKSIAHLPSPPVNIEKENTTINLAVTSTLDARAKLAAKKPRSKSIGPGGLDALKEDSGNRRQVV